jgi:hypothetical protein
MKTSLSSHETHSIITVFKQPATGPGFESYEFRPQPLTLLLTDLFQYYASTRA